MEGHVMLLLMDHSDLRSVAAHLALEVQDVNMLINAEVYISLVCYCSIHFIKLPLCVITLIPDSLSLIHI